MKLRLSTLGLHLAIFFAMTYGYEHYISVIYGYEGYRLEPDQANWTMAVAAVVALSLVTPVRAERPSTLFYHIVLSFVLIPMMVLFYAQGQAVDYMAQVSASYALSVAALSVMK